MSIKNNLILDGWRVVKANDESCIEEALRIAQKCGAYKASVTVHARPGQDEKFATVEKIDK